MMITMAMGRIQKQPFVNIFQNRCSEEFRNIHRKAPESPFNNVAGLKAWFFQGVKIECTMNEWVKSPANKMGNNFLVELVKTNVYIGKI